MPARGLITAVMLTGKHPARRPLAETAIRCFQQQTYAPRELLIVNHGSRSILPRIVAGDGWSIRELHLPSSALSRGAARNLGLREALGDWVIQWDDDDWHHPRRIELQAAHAEEGCAQLLRWQIRYSFVLNTGWIYQCSQGIAGTVLHSRDPDLLYREDVFFEDSQFLEDHFRPQHVRVYDNPPDMQPGAALYVRFHHGHNSCNDRHIMKQFARSRDAWRMPQRLVQFVRNLLEQEYRSVIS